MNEEIKKIVADPLIGRQKKQDLNNVFVHKFKMADCQYLLAYMFDPSTLTLIFLGVHEIIMGILNAGYINLRNNQSQKPLAIKAKKR